MIETTKEFWAITDWINNRKEAKYKATREYLRCKVRIKRGKEDAWEREGSIICCFPESPIIRCIKTTIGYWEFVDDYVIDKMTDKYLKFHCTMPNSNEIRTFTIR